MCSVIKNAIFDIFVRDGVSMIVHVLLGYANICLTLQI